MDGRMDLRWMDKKTKRRTKSLFKTRLKIFVATKRARNSNWSAKKYSFNLVFYRCVIVCSVTSHLSTKESHKTRISPLCWYTVKPISNASRNDKTFFKCLCETRPEILLSNCLPGGPQANQKQLCNYLEMKENTNTMAIEGLIVLDKASDSAGYKINWNSVVTAVSGI